MAIIGIVIGTRINVVVHHSDILVLKLISVLVFILFSSQNFFILFSFSFFGSMIILVFI